MWAGLAHAILHQLAQQIEDPKSREEFWLRLQLARINIDAIRRDVYRWLIARAAPLLLFWIAVAVLLKSALWVAGVIPCLLWLHKRVLGSRFEKYITEPGYEAQLGLLHLVDHDLDRALRLLVGNRPIAVFIDDLDRCDPQTVNQIVLAINQFLSLPNRNVYFILGMDMEMVAAALEQAQKPEDAARHGRTFGWRFMEKFIQLPFVIPHLDAATAKNFASAHLRRASGEKVPAETIDIAELIASVDEATSPVEVGKIAKKIAAADIQPANRAIFEQAFSRRTPN